MEKFSRLGRRFLLAATLAGTTLLMNGCMLSFAQRADEAAAGAQAAAIAQPQQPADVVLAGLSALPTGEVVRLADGDTAVAADHYFAASGRECRFVTIMSGSGQGLRRLACLVGNAWAWQRDVLPR